MPIKTTRPTWVTLGSLTLITATLLSLTGCSQNPETGSAATVAVTGPSKAKDSLVAAIQGIDAAIYGYGIVGAHLAGNEQKKAVRAMTTLTRQRLTFMLAVGEQVDATAVAYELPFEVTNTASAKKLAAQLEVKLLPLLSAVIADTTGPVNAAARVAKTKASARAAVWAGAPLSPTPSTSPVAATNSN